MQRFVLDTVVPLGLRIVVTSRPEGILDPEKYVEKWVIMNLKPLDSQQQMRVVKQQIPQHSEFFDNLGWYKKVQART